MPRSSGGVRQRPTGLWEGQYVVAGRRRSVYGRTKREAEEKLRAARVAIDNGIRPIAGRATVGSFLADWLDSSVATRNKPSTLASYRETVARYIAPAIGGRSLAKLEPVDVRRMVDGLTARGDLSPTTVRYAHTVLRIALARALKDGKVVRNVAVLVDPPRRVRPELFPLTADQARRLLEGTAGDRLGPLYAVAVATGMRQGELLGLRWTDVDLDAGSVTVRHTLTRTGKLAEPKTERARRTLRLGPATVALLRDHRARQPVRGREGYVFASTVGTPLDGHNVTHELQTALARLGLPRQRFHDLRHAFATLMLEDGEELAVVSRALGHSTITTTADVYLHTTPAMLERAAARMDRILGGVASG